MEEEMEYEWNPDWKPPVKNHEYTMEAIFHFTCGKCSQWWSYASTEVIDFHISYEMNCPHCGYQTNLKKKEN
jgi:DNA-directed RNA polymerase subunit RPC12/RpoP